MEKKRKKMPVKSRLRMWYQVCALVCALTVVLAVPMVANASEPSEDDYSFDVAYGNIYGYKLYATDNFVYYDVTRPFNATYNVTLWETTGYDLILEFPLYDCITEYETLIASATNAWLQVTFDIELSTYAILQYAPTGRIFTRCLLGDNGNSYQTDSISVSDFNGTLSGKYTLPLMDLGSELRDIKDITLFTNRIFFQYMDVNSDNLSITCSVKSYSAVIYLQGIDSQSAEQFIVLSNDLENIDSSIQQVKDEVKVIQGQLDNIDNSISQGFDEVGGKLDNIQSDINTGLDNVTGAINGSGADTSGMDNGMAQLGGQLGNLGDVEDQLGGLIMDKVEVPDLILTNDQGSALGLLVSCLNLAYVDLSDYQVMFAAVLFFGIVGVLLFGRRNL